MQKQSRIGGLLVLCGLFLSGCPDTPKQAAQEAVPMVHVLQLANGNTLYPESVRIENDAVIVELSEVGEIVLTQSEITSMRQVPADSLSKQGTGSEESRLGLVFIDGQWTSPDAGQAKPVEPSYNITRRYYFEESEAGLAEAQRALEKATDARADASEIQALSDEIRRLRDLLVNKKVQQRQVKEMAQEKLDAKQQKALEAKWDRMGLNAVERAQAQMSLSADPEDERTGSPSSADEIGEEDRVEIITYHDDGTVTVDRSF